MVLESQTGILYKNANEIKEVELIPELKEFEKLITNTCEYFFKINMKMNSFPFKGFILEGAPGTGKTEIVKQSIKRLNRRMNNIFFVFIDGSSIAAPKWGDAEKRLKDVFDIIRNIEKVGVTNPKLVILFDDIESLMISRGNDLAKEWHYSINSILFHELDELNPNKTIVCATTNRMDLVDEAIKTRLYPLSIDYVSSDSFQPIIREILDASIQKEKDKVLVEKMVFEELKKIPKPSIRDARQITVIECIKSGVWTV